MKECETCMHAVQIHISTTTQNLIVLHNARNNVEKTHRSRRLVRLPMLEGISPLKLFLFKYLPRKKIRCCEMSTFCTRFMFSIHAKSSPDLWGYQWRCVYPHSKYYCSRPCVEEISNVARIVSWSFKLLDEIEATMASFLYICSIWFSSCVLASFHVMFKKEVMR